MKALQCDRCGKFYIPDKKKNKNSAMLEGINIERIGITDGYDIGYDGRMFDICPKCAKSFVLWFKEVEMDIAKEAMTENELHSVVE